MYDERYFAYVSYGETEYKIMIEPVDDDILMERYYLFTSAELSYFIMIREDEDKPEYTIQGSSHYVARRLAPALSEVILAIERK